MKRRGILLFTITLLVASLCSGCGDALYVMTSEEEDQVVAYSAAILAKYNTYQKDGIKVMNTDTLEAALAEPTAPAETEAATEVAEDDSYTINPETGEVETSASAEGTAETLTETISLAGSIGMEGTLNVTYDDYYLTDCYKEGNYYMVDAKTGKLFLVMEYTISNPTSQDVSLNLAGNGLTYYVSVNNGAWIAEEVSFSLVDLATYKGVIKAGESEKVIGLFGVNADLDGNISSVSLAVAQDGVKKQIF